MQRNRKIRKVVQPPIVVEHTTNIHRRQDSRNFVKSVPSPNNHAARLPINKSVGFVNSAQAPLSTIKYTTIQRKFEGETVYIIGGGPSLKNFDFRQLAGARTIAINKAMLYHTQTDVLYWTDVRFYTKYKI